MKRHLIIANVFAVITAFGAPLAHAQKPSSAPNEKNYTITLSARAYGDSVVLRWMPDDAALWTLGNQHGWTITRTGGKGKSSHRGSVVNTVKPWPLEQIASVFGTGDLVAGALAQSLYAPSNVAQSLADSRTTLVEYVCRMRDEQAGRRAVAMTIANRSARYADAAGLRFADRDVEPGAVYEYTISYAGDKSIFTCQDVSQIVRINAATARHSIGSIEVKPVDASRVAVSWPPSDYSGFFIERSLRGDKADDTLWHKLNDSPIVKLDALATAMYAVLGVSRENVVFIDSLQAGQTAVYRVRGYDLFADCSPWGETKAYTMPEGHALKAPLLVKATPADSGRCCIEWQLPADETYHGFAVAYAKNGDDVWTNVSGKLARDVTTFVDSTAGKRGVGYYRVYAFDSTGRLSFSNLLPGITVDSLSPAAPAAPRAVASLVKTDRDGLHVNTGRAAVKISWNKLNKKNAEDLWGYRVFSSDKRDGAYGEVSPSILAANSFTDTVNVEGETAVAYYYVVSVDSRGNNSQPSDTIQVALPDIIKPLPCEWKSTTSADNKTSIKWHRSKSPDVVKYNIYSQTPGSGNRQWLTTIDSTTYGESPYVTYRVALAAQLFPVEYSIEAVDASGNVSEPGGFVSLPANAEADPGITLKAKYNRKTSSVTLTWQYAAKPDAKFQGLIYRTAGDGKPVAVGAFKPSQTSFTDSRLPNAKRATYHIVLKTSASEASKPSSPATVTLK